eukprot:6948134-Pyramimonas_sp.AAC.1
MIATVTTGIISADTTHSIITSFIRTTAATTTTTNATTLITRTTIISTTVTMPQYQCYGYHH